MKRTSIVLELLMLQMYDVGGHSVHEVLQQGTGYYLCAKLGSRYIPQAHGSIMSTS